jgi:hypothetical protein
MNLESIVQNTGNNFKTAGKKAREYAPLWVPPVAGAGIVAGVYSLYGYSFYSLFPALLTLSAGFGLIGLMAYAIARPFWHYYYSHKK